MEFDTLTRRELQGLCKKNKIPANITNVGMIENLKALSFVEGLEELMQQSPGQRAAAKQEPDTAGPLTRTRRTTRKTVAKDVIEGAMETPSVVQTTTTRRTRVTSVCRKMDAELKECEEEEDKQKGVVETPAPSGVTTRRRRGVKEETTVVKREYSTRRSVRLAEKVEEVVDDVKNEKSDLFKTEFAKDGENVSANVEEGLDTVEEASGVTGTDSNETLEENLEEVDESEVVSAQNHQMQVGEESNLAAIVEILEGKDESESIHVEEQQVIQTVEETENATAFDEETSQMSEVDDQKENATTFEEETSQMSEVDDHKESATTVEEETSQMTEVDDLKLDVEQVPSKGMDVDVNLSVEEIPEGHDVSENVSVEAMCEDQDMAFDGDEEQETDQIYQASDDSKDDQRSEVSLMNEADEESAMQESFEGSDSLLNFKPTCLTPFKEVYVRKATSAKNEVTIVTDNKENVGNESMVVKEMVKKADKAKDFSDFSVRQLTKMLKEKLEITKKAPKNENVNEAHGRPALQALPENRMVDEGRN